MQAVFITIVILVAFFFSGYSIPKISIGSYATKEVIIPLFSQTLYNTSKSFIINITGFFISNKNSTIFRIKGVTFNISKTHIERVGNTTLGVLLINVNGVGSKSFDYVFTPGVNFYIAPLTGNIGNVKVSWINDYVSPVFLIFLNVTFISVD